MKLSQLTQELGCQLEGPDGCGDLEIRGIAPLELAGEGELTFLTDSRLAPMAASTRASALLLGESAAAVGRNPALPLLRSPQVELSVPAAIARLRPAWRPQPGIHPSASIDPSAVLGGGCHVGAFVAIGANCRIGAGAVLHPHVVVYPDVQAGERLVAHAHAVIREGTRLGDDVTLQPGVVVGGDGFGFARRKDGGYVKIPQVGHVEIGDRVEIQSNASVDRATLAATRIGAGTKIDSLSQVGHNCELAEDVLLCAQVGLAGSTRIERGAVLAGQVGVAGHCTIGAGATITAQSGTHGDLEGGRVYSGSPAFDHGQWLRSVAAFGRLADLQRELRALRQQMREWVRKSGD